LELLPNAHVGVYLKNWTFNSSVFVYFLIEDVCCKQFR